MALQLQSLNILEKGWKLLLSPKEIIEIIEKLPIKEALGYLTAQGILHFSKEGFSLIKQKIQAMHNESNFAFVPDKEEAKLLKSFKDHSYFRQISLLVPKYRYIDIIRTGILINYYHENDTPENRKKVENIKRHLIRRPNGSKLLKIANLPTTPFFEIILELLYDLKSEGYSEENLEETLDELITVWENVTMLVESKHNIHEVLGFCEDKIYDSIPIFIICGMKSASKMVEDAIEKLQEGDFLYRNGYEFELTKNLEGNFPRTQILFIKDRLSF